MYVKSRQDRVMFTMLMMGFLAIAGLIALDIWLSVGRPWMSVGQAQGAALGVDLMLFFAGIMLREAIS